MLLRDIDASGNAPHLKEIQAAAAAHGIKVSLPKAGQREGLFSSLADTAVRLAEAAAPETARFYLKPPRGRGMKPSDLEALRKTPGVRIVALTPRIVTVEGDAAAIEEAAASLGWTSERPIEHVASGTRNL